MKKNEKGFSVVELLILLVIIGLVGTVGWLVFDRQKESKPAAETVTNNSSPEKEPEEAKIPEGFAYFKIGDTGVTLLYPSSWGEAKPNSTSAGGGYSVNGMTFEIEDKNSVQVSRSFNAPSYCKYNHAENSWTKTGEYPPNSCEPEILTVSNIKAYGFSKGALGAYGFSYGANLKGGNFLWIRNALLANGQNQDPATYPSESDIAVLKTDLKKNVGILLSNNKQLFE